MVYEVRQNNRLFRIEEDYPEVGAYLYVFESDKCILDDLQNDVHTCKLVALEDFGVPIEQWELISSAD